MGTSEIGVSPSKSPIPIWTHLAPFAAWAFLRHILGDPAPWKDIVCIAAAVSLAGYLRPWRDAATWAHVSPFAAWIALMMGLGEPTAIGYAMRTCAGLGFLLASRPWRWYSRPRIRNLPAAFLVGMLVFAIWVFPESPWMSERAPGVYRFYVRFLVGLWPFGKMPEISTTLPSASPFAPETCGWAFTLIRLGGSALVIAAIEEYFWRSFLYRWMMGSDFLKVDPGRLEWSTLLIVSLVFASAHEQWFAGLLCGLAYGLLFIRTRDIGAAIFAHMVTNFVLGLYVLTTGLYHFW